jgi:hypothetical protein
MRTFMPRVRGPYFIPPDLPVPELLFVADSLAATLASIPTVATVPLAAGLDTALATHAAALRGAVRVADAAAAALAVHEAAAAAVVGAADPAYQSARARLALEGPAAVEGLPPRARLREGNRLLALRRLVARLDEAPERAARVGLGAATRDALEAHAAALDAALQAGVAAEEALRAAREIRQAHAEALRSDAREALRVLALVAGPEDRAALEALRAQVPRLRRRGGAGDGQPEGEGEADAG